MTPPTASAEGWLVVLRPDGVVDAALGGVSVGWLGRTLDDAPAVPDAVRRAAAELVMSPTTEHVRRRRVHCANGEHEVDVEIVVIEALPLRRVLTSVHDLVMRTLDLFVSQARSNAIDLSFDLEKTAPPAVLVDREKIAWAISTLVGNALRYAKKHVDVHVSSNGERELVIAVSDDGPGIPQQQARWLFEHNPTTGHAAGLALLMVRDVVGAHRGAISVRSTLGQGSTFTMRIPRLQ